MLTYAYDRASEAVTLTNDPPLEAGQWGSAPLSRGVRTADAHRVQIPAGPLTAAAGAVVIYYEPDNAYNGGGQPAIGAIFEWYQDASNYIHVYYSKASARWEFFRRAAGVLSSGLYLADTWTAGQGKALYLAWSATAMHIAADAGPISSQADTNDPATLPATFDVGWAPSAPLARLDASYGAVLAFSEALTDDVWDYLGGLRTVRCPGAYEVSKGNAATWDASRWVGTLETIESATVFGLHDVGAAPEITMRNLRGAGMPAVVIEADESPYRDGSVYNASRLGQRFLTADLDLYGDHSDGWARLQDMRQALLGAINPMNGIGLITYTPDDVAYIIEGVYQGGSPLDDQFLERFHRTSPIFECPDPAWRVATPNLARIEAPTGGLSIPLTIPLTLAEAGGSGAASNVGAGTLPARPLIRIRGPVVNPQANNDTTGKLCGFSLTLLTGEVLDIDMDRLTAVLQDGTNKIGNRLASAVFWELQRGTNSVQITFDSTTASPVVADVIYDTRLIGV